MPNCGDYNAPIIYTIPLQILAYEVACLRGTDLDQPRNLAKSVTVEAASTITGFSTDVGSTLCDGSYFYSTGEAIRINTLVYNNDVGIATVTTTNRHGLRVDNKVAFTGANEALYNGRKNRFGSPRCKLGK